MDADLELDPDPFAEDPEGLARWSLECVAIERAVRAAMTAPPPPRAVTRCRASESGVFPSAGSDAALLDFELASDGPALGGQLFGDSRELDDTFDGLA